MATLKEISINDLMGFTGVFEEALKYSKKTYKDENGAPELITNWYRGVGSSREHTLVPTLYRHDESKVDKLLEMEIRMVELFKRRGSMFQEIKALNSSEPEDQQRLDLLFFMQHHGVPTRLLDWTENPYIALFFALTAARFDSKKKRFIEPAAVWILDPVGWNGTAVHGEWGFRGPLGLNEELVNGYTPGIVHHARPAAIFGTYNNKRIAAQRGVFVIFGKKRTPMEEAFVKDDYPSSCLKKIIIGEDHIPALLEELVSTGFTDSASYPDLYGLAMEIKRHFGFQMNHV